MSIRHSPSCTATSRRSLSSPTTARTSGRTSPRSNSSAHDRSPSSPRRCGSPSSGRRSTAFGPRATRTQPNPAPTVHLHFHGGIRIPCAEPSPSLYATLKQTASFHNPEFYARQRCRSTRSNPSAAPSTCDLNLDRQAGPPSPGERKPDGSSAPSCGHGPTEHRTLCPTVRCPPPQTVRVSADHQPSGRDRMRRSRADTPCWRSSRSICRARRPACR